MQKNNVYISAFSSISSLGIGNGEVLSSLEKSIPLITYPAHGDIFKFPCFKIKDDIFYNPNDDTIATSQIILKLLEFIEPSIKKLKETPIFIGTSTGGIRETEKVYKDIYDCRVKYALFKRHFFNKMITDIKSKYKDLTGDYYTFSTACSSSGHSILQAYRFIKNGIINKAIVVGVDTLSLTTMIGFDSLKLVSHDGTKPLTTLRNGLSLGEGGGILLLESNPENQPIAEIVGCHSNSDGYHISSPAPDGLMQKECIKRTLEEANISYSDVDYINAHGTGTPMNDEIELNTIKSLFDKTIVSSLKSFIGHTLGASTTTEIGILLASLRKNKIYQIENFSNPMDDKLVLTKTIDKEVKYFLKNSFGFGGNNFTVAIKMI